MWLRFYILFILYSINISYINKNYVSLIFMFQVFLKIKMYALFTSYFEW